MSPLERQVRRVAWLIAFELAFELVFAVVVVYVPLLQSVFDTQLPPASMLPWLAAFPIIVWAADELHRARLRRRDVGGGTP